MAALTTYSTRVGTLPLRWYVPHTHMHTLSVCVCLCARTLPIARGLAYLFGSLAVTYM